MKGTEVPRLRLYRPQPELRIYNPRRDAMAKKKKANKPPVPVRKKPLKINRKKLDDIEWQPTVRRFGDHAVEVAELSDGWYARLTIDDGLVPITVLTQKPFPTRIEAQEGLTRVVAWVKEMFPPREENDGQPTERPDDGNGG